MIYGYARVSTAGQARDGNSLEAQEKALKEAGAEVIFTDAFTGKKMDRPGLQKLLGELKEGDKLIITKIDRFGRSLSQASNLITELLDKGIVIHVLNLGILSNDSVNTLLRNVLLAFAQFERDMIVERTQEGKEIAKMNNPEWREGRKEKVVDLNLFQKLQSQVEDKAITVMEAAKQLGVSRSKWYKLIKEIA